MDVFDDYMERIDDPRPYTCENAQVRHAGDATYPELVVDMHCSTEASVVRLDIFLMYDLGWSPLAHEDGYLYWKDPDGQIRTDEEDEDDEYYHKDHGRPRPTPPKNPFDPEDDTACESEIGEAVAQFFKQEIKQAEWRAHKRLAWKIAKKFAASLAATEHELIEEGGA